MQAQQKYIQNYAHFKAGILSLNGTEVFRSSKDDTSEVFKEAYRAIDLNYSKFFKMDTLSKLAMLTTEILFREANLDTEDNNIAVILSNKASSLDTDRKHQESISDQDNFYPSPAVFVYTLPNICIGEISIKHKLFSENSFFIFDTFSAAHLFDYARVLMDSNKAHRVLCGWVDVDAQDYEAFMYLVRPEQTEITHTTKEINRLYTSL
ncbi:MAG: 3-oxoacyl-(acyl-carrier-protein) synthase [Patiriisocius sp.]